MRVGEKGELEVEVGVAALHKVVEDLDDVVDFHLVVVEQDHVAQAAPELLVLQLDQVANLSDPHRGVEAGHVEELLGGDVQGALDVV